MRALPILAVLAIGNLAIAADPGFRRTRPPVTLESEAPDLGDKGESAEPEAPDEDDGFDDGQDVPPVPRGPALRPPSPKSPSTPRGEGEEPIEQPEHAPALPGALEPASAMQPALPE